MIEYEGRKMPCFFQRQGSCKLTAEYRIESSVNIMHVCTSHLNKVLNGYPKGTWRVTTLAHSPKLDSIPATSLDNFELSKQPWIVRIIEHNGEVIYDREKESRVPTSPK
jgi:hypothetical protein